MSNSKPSRGVCKDSKWADVTGAAFREAQEDIRDVKYFRRMEAAERIKKFGIKVGAKFRGQLNGRKTDKKLEDEYTVIKIDKEAEVAFLKGKKDEKVRRVTLLSKIFGPRTKFKSLS